MPLSTADLHGTANRALATVEDLERELAERRAEAEQAARDAAEAAKEAEAEQRRCEQVGRGRLAELEGQLSAAMAAPDDDLAHLLSLRGRARVWLHGGNPEAVSRSLELSELAERDLVAGRLHGVHRELVGLTVYLMGEAGLDADHEQVARSDALECASWRSPMVRVRFLAGEG
jgi:hypothetical protein